MIQDCSSQRCVKNLTYCIENVTLYFVRLSVNNSEFILK